MKINANKYLVIGIVLLAVGLTMLMTGAVSKPIAYGDFAAAIVFFVLALRDDNK